MIVLGATLSTSTIVLIHEEATLTNDDTTSRLTIKSTPPNVRKPQRRAYWPGVFSEARECPGEWIRTNRWFNKGTAAQIASDLRNAHRRATGKMRVSGFLPGDQWETRWDNDPADPNADHFYIWLRFDGITRLDRIRMLEETAW